MKSLRTSFTRGFTLVEVVLALGIATIGLVSILGLLNAATDADSDAARDTTVVAIADYALNDLRTVPFDSLWTDDPTQHWNATPSMSPKMPDTIYYFSNEGSPIPASNAASDSDLLYKCVVRKTPDPASQNLLTGYYNLVKVQLDFYWPATVGDEVPSTPSPTGNRQSPRIPKKTLYVSIARH